MIKIVRGVMCAALFVLATACTNNSDDLGVQIQPQEDQIVVAADTFHVSTKDFFVDAISAQVDTLLLGNFYSSKYGSTQGELLVQFAPPLDYVFPSAEYNPEPDSLVLLMYYRNWFGSSTSPLQISIYEINKEPLIYTEKYMSNVDVAQFSDLSILMGQSVMTSIDKNLSDSIVEDEDYIPAMRYKLSKEQIDRFFNFPASAYESLDAFNDLFKGMYITSTYGSATMLHLLQIDMKLYYHYTYEKMGKDTVVNASIVYPANQEVRQLNKFVHNNLEEVMISRDSVNYMTATAGAYPKVTLPIGRMRERIGNEIGGRMLNFNRAVLTVEATELDSSDLALPIPPNVMLVRESDLEYYLQYNEIPSSADSTAIVAYYSSTNQSYTFDLAYMLTKMVRSDMSNYNEEMEMVMVPVDIFSISSTSSSTISSVRPRARLAGVTVRSGKNSYSPMRLEVVYSGF